MDFLKNFLKNDKTVVGLCDLKRRQALNTFNFAKQYNFTQPFNTTDFPGGILYAK